MQAGRARPAEEAVPQARAKANHARQLPLRDAKPDRSPEPTDIRQQATDFILAARIHGQHQKDRRLGERRQNRLWLGCLHNASAFSRAGKPISQSSPS